MLLLIAFLIGAGSLSAVVIMFLSIKRLTGAVPTENRLYLDPLPPMLRALWPLVKFVDHHFGTLVRPGTLSRIEQQLRVTGLLFLLSPGQFAALRILSTLIAMLMGILPMVLLSSFSPWILLGMALLGWYYPRIWVHDIRRRHVARILKQLPIYLDFLTLAVEAGLNLNGALKHAVEKGPDGPLRREFEHMLRDLKSGLSRTEALRRLDERVEIREISNFVGVVIQADRMGSGMAAALRFQADQRRVERFQRAEKQAMEAPVKLVFPLLVFIFPITFIVLAFPIVMKFMQEGLL